MQTTHDEVRSMPTMHVERTGSGQPLVLVGGGLTGRASWQPHAERLAATRDVARLQQLGVQYGLEDRPLPDDYSVRMESDALAAALDGIGWTQAIDFVAWSYGALITLDFALNQPHRVRTLTLIEPPAHWVLPDRGRALPDVQALITLHDLRHADVGAAELVRFLRTAALVPPDMEPESHPQWETWMRHRRSLRTGDVAWVHEDEIARLHAFPAPVLLVTGHGTSPFLRAVHDTLAKALPNVRTLELPGGHAPQLVAMDEFLDRLAEFQESAPATGRGVMHTVASRDGTRIAFWRSGHGPPLLLVHGATADHTTTWRFVLPGFERHFTAWAKDRRGRGGSGDADEYDLRREAEDVAAVVDFIANATGEAVNVLGHSFGALAAMEAALLTPNVRRLILYEGVPLRGADHTPPAILDRFDAMLAAGDLDGVLTALFRDLVRMPPEELAMMRSQRDAWATRLRNTRALPRELRADAAYAFRPERFGNMRAPTLLLVGGDSPPHELRNATGIAAALPDARVLVLQGQRHAAMYMVPDVFIEEVVRFAREP